MRIILFIVVLDDVAVRFIVQTELNSVYLWGEFFMCNYELWCEIQSTNQIKRRTVILFRCVFPDIFVGLFKPGTVKKWWQICQTNYTRALLVPLLKLLNSLTPLLFSNLFTGLKLMNVFSIKFSLSPLNFSIPCNLPTCMTWSLSKLHVKLDLHLLSLLLVHQLAPP